MKKIALAIILICSVACTIAQDIPPKPKPERLVNDLADMLTDQEEQLLERKLVSYNDTTSTQIAVVTIKSLEGNDVIDYAYRIGEAWGVGQAGKNNGVVILMSESDRETAIVSGYGMEGVLTDAAASRIQRNHMTPNFRNGNFYQGLDEATTAIIQLAAGEYTGEDGGAGGKGIGGAVIFFIILFFVILPILSAIGRSRKNHFGRKGLNFWTILWILSHMGGGGRRGGGGGGWGGGSSGGGFGGFGGGSFGGGGARGSW